MRITTVGLDADDTLWHNESIFRLKQELFFDLLVDVADRDILEARLEAVNQRNLGLYGYGVKGFTLSMLETAMELTDGQAPARVVREILAAGREMLTHPVEPLPGVEAALAALAERYRLVLITKGDLLHQEQKLAASGLGELFVAVEIVSEKNASTYRRVFDSHGTGPAEAVMCGNSLRSDILPALEAGAFAAHVPYAVTWIHEMAEPPMDHPRFGELASIADLPAWIEQIRGQEKRSPISGRGAAPGE
jgi:putative hydrolase of the HAD superfamily